MLGLPPSGYLAICPLSPHRLRHTSPFSSLSRHVSRIILLQGASADARGTSILRSIAGKKSQASAEQICVVTAQVYHIMRSDSHASQHLPFQNNRKRGIGRRESGQADDSGRDLRLEGAVSPEQIGWRSGAEGGSQIEAGTSPYSLEWKVHAEGTTESESPGT